MQDHRAIIKDYYKDPTLHTICEMKYINWYYLILDLLRCLLSGKKKKQHV